MKIRITPTGFLALAVATLVPSGVALYYALLKVSRLLARVAPALDVGPYDGIPLYIFFVIIGFLCFVLLILLMEEIFIKIMKVKQYNIYIFNAPGLKPQGLTAGGLRRSVALVLLNHDTSEELAKFIELHEEAHVKNNHPAKVWLVGALLFGETSAITMDYKALGALAPYVYVFSAAVMMSTLFALFIVVRALEINADIYVFRQLGANSYDYFVKLMKTRYGNWRPPLRTRLTHAQGGIALLFGDPLAAHAPWEYPLAFSPLAAALFLLPLAISFQPAQEHPVAYFLLLFPATLLLIYLVSSALKPLSRSSAKGKYTERGALNLSRLLASLYVVTLASATAAKPAGPLALLIASLFSFLLYKSIIELYKEFLNIKKLNLMYLAYIFLLNLLIFII